MSLWHIFTTNQDRVIHKWTHYFPAYEKHFSQFRNAPFTLLEIGCGQGGSLQMWKKYFGPLVTIVGIDIRPECADMVESQINIRIGDQSDPAFLRQIIDEFGVPDIVIDDGSHVMSHIKASFDFLYPKMRPRNVYLVEDLHTAYWDEYEGGFKRSGTFIEDCKDMIDQLNAAHTRGALEDNDFSRSTISMHFYDSLVVFEKGSYGAKHAPQIGGSR